MSFTPFVTCSIMKLLNFHYVCHKLGYWYELLHSIMLFLPVLLETSLSVEYMAKTEGIYLKVLYNSLNFFKQCWTKMSICDWSRRRWFDPVVGSNQRLIVGSNQRLTVIRIYNFFLDIHYEELELQSWIEIGKVPLLFPPKLVVSRKI